MSVLAIQLPPRERLSARAAGTEAASGMRLPAEWPFVFSADGKTATQAAQAGPAALPRADRVVLVLADADVSWHRIEIPKAPPAKLRAALVGVMEDALLEDDEALHFALAPDAVPGKTGWVAVTHRPRLLAALNALEVAGLSIERVITPSLPGSNRGHFYNVEAADAEPAPWLSLTQAESAVCLRLAGGLARTLLPAEAADIRYTATPAAAAAAEHWLAAPVALQTESERTLEAVNAAGGKLNLRQFDAVARHRGMRALRDVGKRFMSTEWQPVRLGLAAVLAMHLIGLNLYAWQQRQTVTAKRSAMVDLLRNAHPGVRAVLDAPLQMQAETGRVRARAGRPGDNDLEALMGAAAGAWPDGLGPVQMMRFEGGRLTLAAPGWAEPQVAQFRDRLRGVGFVAELAEGRITISRGAAAGPVGAKGSA
jgi:general secretion pathway protein L